MSGFERRRKKLSRLLILHGLTPNQLALEAKLPPSTVYRLLNGEIKMPALDTWETICAAFARLVPSTDAKEETR